MAVDMFLKIDKVFGESSAKGHEGSIEVMSFSWGANTPDGVQFQDFHFVQDVDKSTPKLFGSMLQQSSFSWGEFTARRALKDGRKQDFYYVKLTDILISSFQNGGSQQGGVPNAQISLNYSKIEDMWYVTPGGKKHHMFGDQT